MAIEPNASGTVLEFSKEVESMLGWRVGQASLERTEDLVWVYILRQFPLLGRAPKSQEIRDWYGDNSLTKVQTVLERLHTLDIVYLDPETREIRLAYPFSTMATKHVVRFQGWAESKPVYAPCALDALGINFMVGQDLSIESFCGSCMIPLTFEVRNGMITTCTTAETVLWVGTAYCCHAATSICPTLDFFCSPEHFATWRKERQSKAGAVLDLGEALYLAKKTFANLVQEFPRQPLSNTTRFPSPGLRKGVFHEDKRESE